MSIDQASVFKCPFCHSPYALAIDLANSHITIHRRRCRFLSSHVKYLNDVRIVPSETLEEADHCAMEVGTRYIYGCSVCSSKISLVRWSIGLTIVAVLTAGLVLGYRVETVHELLGAWLLVGYCWVLPLTGWWAYIQLNKHLFQREAKRLEKLRQSRMVNGH